MNSTSDSFNRRKHIEKCGLFSLQDYFLLTIKIVRNMFPRPFTFADWIEQMDKIEWFFVDCRRCALLCRRCICVECPSQFARFAKHFQRVTRCARASRELGPVFVALLRGPERTAMASELGSMFVTYQWRDSGVRPRPNPQLMTALVLAHCANATSCSWHWGIVAGLSADLIVAN